MVGNDAVIVALAGVVGWVTVIRLAIEMRIVNVPHIGAFFSWFLTLGISVALVVIPFAVIVLIEIACVRLYRAWVSWRDPFHLVREYIHE